MDKEKLKQQITESEMELKLAGLFTPKAPILKKKWDAKILLQHLESIERMEKLLKSLTPIN